MFLTARQLEDLHRANGSNGHLVLPYRARLTPLAEAGAQLENSNPTLAGQVADITTTTAQLRDEHKTRTPDHAP